MRYYALIPPVLAIVVSIITKEVNLALALGVLIGACIVSGFDFFGTTTTILDIMSDKVYGNLGVIVFIILLGMIVHLINLSGATTKYAEWARRRVHTKKRALLVTMLLGLVIFIDDYFNCLTVGTVMRPITDRNNISREKLAYIIDSTAAPVCIIAPISSWAAAVSSSLPDDASIDGFTLFVRSISCNFYSWFSLGMVFLTILFTIDYGPMRIYEYRTAGETLRDEGLLTDEGKGSIIDLVAPILSLIVFSVLSMLYTGGYYNGDISVGEAFADCDAILALAMGGIYTVLLLVALYLPRKIVTPKEFLGGIEVGFKNMVPSTLILVLAWTLSGVCGKDYLDVGGFVVYMIEAHGLIIQLMPVIFFASALVLSFSTGTSWGTFAILLPISTAVFSSMEDPMMVITTAAVLGGAVCGDHLSPISDTTILSSAGAGCEHIDHVISQMPYGIAVAVISGIGYTVSGFTGNGWLGMAVGGTILFAATLMMYLLQKKTQM